LSSSLYLHAWVFLFLQQLLLSMSKEKFFRLSKKFNFRSRSAFKLIQIEKKFNLLRFTNRIIDLCCFPGGWLQIIQLLSKRSYLIVGVDLVKIKPLQSVIFIKMSIRSPMLYPALNKISKGAYYDCLLNDGSPNVGTENIIDSEMQNGLAFFSFKIAIKVLRDGGSLVSKFFISKNLNIFIYLLRILFKYVIILKPNASRVHSSEVYILNFNFSGFKKKRYLDIDSISIKKNIVMNLINLTHGTSLNEMLSSNQIIISIFLKRVLLKKDFKTIKVLY